MPIFENIINLVLFVHLYRNEWENYKGGRKNNDHIHKLKLKGKCKLQKFETDRDETSTLKEFNISPYVSFVSETGRSYPLA